MENENELKKFWSNIVSKTYSNDKDNKKIKYYANSKDEEALNANYDLSYFYNTHLVPQPYWGNIDNPSVIILAKNPGYDFENDESDEGEIGEKILTSLQEKSDISCLNLKAKSAYAFWTRVLDIFLPKDETEKEKEFEKIMGKIGIFNYIPYHCTPYYQMPIRVFSKGSCLPSQVAMENYIEKYLNENDETYVIVVWGKNEWLKKGSKLEEYLKFNSTDKSKGGLVSEKGIVLNSIHPRNNSLNNFKPTNSKVKGEFEKLIANIKMKLEESN